MLLYNIFTAAMFLISLVLFIIISVDWKKMAHDFKERKKEMTMENSEEKK